MLIYQSRLLVQDQRTYHQSNIQLFICDLDLFPCDFNLQTVVEVKECLKLMFSRPEELVVN